MSIYLIRHAQTDGNAGRRLQVPETPLSAAGVAQAGRLALRLPGEGIGGVLSSDLLRAVRTARIALGSSGIPVVLDERLRERNFGDLRGLCYDELAGDIFAPGYDPPGGESWMDFLGRIDRAWELVVETARKTEGNLAVVTHGFFLFHLARRRLVIELPLERPGMFANTSVTVVDAEPPHKVRLLNCTRHLVESD
jgi:broad specificity phosphatase PhoE